MSDISHYYMVLGQSSNDVVESAILEGYDSNDVYYFLMDNSEAISQKYPIIYSTLCQLIGIYKKQYKMEPNLTNFRDLIDNSDEFGSNFIKIVECLRPNIITACSYYQNNRKVIALKSDSQPSVVTLKTQISMKSEKDEKPTILPKQPVQMKSKIAVKKKVNQEIPSS